MNILVVNSLRGQDKAFLGLFRDLSVNNVFITWTSNKFFLDNFREDELNKKRCLCPNFFENNFLIAFFLLPFFYIYYSWELIFQKKRSEIKTIVCLSFFEKIVFTPIAKLIGINVVWFDGIDIKYEKKSKFLVFFLKLYSRISTTIVFTEEREKKLIEKGFKNIKNVSLGIESDDSTHQDDIFSNLAKTDKLKTTFKSFTIGVVARLDNREQIEFLLKVVKLCLRFIPNIQLVVIGSGKNKKNFLWLARKMEIEKQVWFVGAQDVLGKWFDDFDFYVTTNNSLGLFDLEVILEAMVKKLPVISFYTPNLGELVKNNETGILLKDRNVNILAQAIIDLEQDKKKIKLLGDNANRIAVKYFSRDIQINKINKILNT